MNEDLKGLYAAIILSALVVLGVNYFFPKPVPQTPAAEEVVITPQTEEEKTAEAAEAAPISVEEAIGQDTRLNLKNDVIQGSIRLKGARFDNLQLLKYKEALEENSPNVSLFTPAKTAETYFADYGWLTTDAKINVPNAESVWSAIGNTELTPQTPVTLVWDNGQGIRFINQISLDEHYLFSITQKIENNSGKTVSLLPYGLFSKRIDEDAQSRSVVHEGFVGVLNDKLNRKNLKLPAAGYLFPINTGLVHLYSTTAPLPKLTCARLKMDCFSLIIKANRCKSHPVHRLKLQRNYMPVPKKLNSWINIPIISKSLI